MFLKNPLIEKPVYLSSYNRDLLYRIPRAPRRVALGIESTVLPFHGIDIWNAYELSWLNMKGKPEVRILEFRYPASSEFILESKSLKLYLNSFHCTNFKDQDEVISIIKNDLSLALCVDIVVSLSKLNTNIAFSNFCGTCLDDIDVACNAKCVTPDYLSISEEEQCMETIYSHLLKSNCYITNQPDFGSIQIAYNGKKINHKGLLQYLISYRNHSEFHEQCIERIFMDIMKYCKPKSLTIYARYTRRGGIDINPFRSTESNTNISNLRLIRQ
ncbi:NADPH-dependent 7-cyano-7-deazaguanine reductase QueF [Candidatus Lariskella endosymbiont of Epinotia ramella]|uniref:NADPH-dependent 7-cyano-7-deazaguanine reductase QueF n=1 Tax=Candidatus Lariskella endosymbiont of Epinotia ramella TaxID=3066224 RepID=UPI0030D4C7F7